MLARAFRTFLNTRDRPTLIIVDSHIAYGAPQQAGHQRRPRRAARRGGSPADQAQLRLAGGREVPASPTASTSTSATASASAARSCATPGSRGSRSTGRSIRSWPTSSTACSTGSCPRAGTRTCPRFPADAKGLATRDASGKVLNALGKNVPWLMGGSADLGPSCKTRLTFDGAGDFFADSPGGRNLHFGIREHAMAAVLNGMALVKVRAYGSALPDLQRLRQAGDPAQRPDGAAGHLRLHARLDRRRRGRPDAPADRATRVAAGHPGPDRPAPRGRQRGGGGLEGHHEAAPRAGRAGSHAAGGADDRPQQVRRRRRAWPAGPTSWPMRRTASRTSCCWRPAAKWRCAWRRTSGSRRRGSRRGW